MIEQKPSRPRRIILGVFGAILSGCMVCILFQNVCAEPAPVSRQDERLRPEPASQFQRVPVHLYFADRHNSFLKSEQRIMLQSDDPTGFGKAIIESLIKGPQKGLVRTIPAATELRAIYIDSEKVCYVDLSEAVKSNHPGGSNSELLTIYSVVNSLILNVPEIEQVKILIDGNESPTLAGHIDLQFPFKAHMLLIR
ncbi:MAG: GerMN domain-containing protein [Deltaproteobacteria bacterium]|nr:GerMN domain-containing protein [Deltaproteobacteria bacterium]